MTLHIVQSSAENNLIVICYDNVRQCLHAEMQTWPPARGVKWAGRYGYSSVGQHKVKRKDEKVFEKSGIPG